ncbi:MAG: hypothetical protein ACRC1K_12210, partial [Planctomycetia bacterium]
KETVGVVKNGVVEISIALRTRVNYFMQVRAYDGSALEYSLRFDYLGPAASTLEAVDLDGATVEPVGFDEAATATPVVDEPAVSESMGDESTPPLDAALADQTAVGDDGSYYAAEVFGDDDRCRPHEEFAFAEGEGWAASFDDWDEEDLYEMFGVMDDLTPADYLAALRSRGFSEPSAG